MVNGRLHLRLQNMSVEDGYEHLRFFCYQGCRASIFVCFCCQIVKTVTSTCVFPLNSANGYEHLRLFSVAMVNASRAGTRGSIKDQMCVEVMLSVVDASSTEHDDVLQGFEVSGPYATY